MISPLKVEQNPPGHFLALVGSRGRVNAFWLVGEWMRGRWNGIPRPASSPRFIADCVCS